MPVITDLTLYPIKSCAGIVVAEAQVAASGLSLTQQAQTLYDREWMLVDDNGQFLSQREWPRMASLRPSLVDGMLSVAADGMPTLRLSLQDHSGASVMVTVWDDTLLARCAVPSAHAWFSRALGVSCRLVRFDLAAPRYASQRWTGTLLAPTRFADGFPLLLTARASLADLNQRAIAQGRAAVPMDRFRPNIVIDDLAAFEEDYAASFEFANGICLKAVKPCSRCNMPAVDQANGKVGPNPIDILQSYRANPILNGEISFGMNLIASAGIGRTLRVGDAVEIPIAF